MLWLLAVDLSESSQPERVSRSLVHGLALQVATTWRRTRGIRVLLKELKAAKGYALAAVLSIRKIGVSTMFNML